ncbi:MULTISPECIES: hypothetical protein [Halobacterium]|uniref:hypothetical protein n=1 Tax=Halobacterium TaxID=2239 RepID=UPI000A7ACB39|nr:MULTISPECIES: hypothetical protein [Halobacterium]MCG1004940.1 hypothetical protein [Halobacterium noricense]
MGSPRELVTAAKIDLTRLLATWRGLLFSRQSDEYAIDNHWQLGSSRDRLLFWFWSAVGIAGLSVIYPIAALGFWIRYVGRQIDRLVAGVGILVIIGLIGILWSGLTALAWTTLSTIGFRAVLAASIVATISVRLSWACAHYNSRTLTFVAAYPFAVAAIFLPPVTAALFSPAIGEVILPNSELFAEWILTNLVVGNLSSIIRQQFELAGFAFVCLWFGIAIPIGWLFAFLVTLAEAIRPNSRTNQSVPYEPRQ